MALLMQLAAPLAVISYKQTRMHYFAQLSFPLPPLRTLTPSQSYSLSILLELSDELIALLDNITILLVLVIRTVGLNNAFASHAINGTGNTTSGDEFGQVTR